ncbi:MAG: PEP-CTERM sorting domain-containing protein [Planctomycetota bacterium]|nr:PEP-CTERM sorting domain-containing protein [Planctomycetota bacterium]
MKRSAIILLSCLVLMILGGQVARAGTNPVVIWHDPWLNWDFLNNTGQRVNDFEIIVDNPNWNPNGNDPTQVLKGMPFPNFTVTHANNDTYLTWSGANLQPGLIAHGGLYMIGSGLVKDAYWTLDGVKVGQSTAITYERTKIVGDPEVHMVLNIAPGWFADHPSEMAGWTHIRTFLNIPADTLNLADLNRDLVLDSLKSYEVTPKRLDGTPILYGDQILMGGPDSFFDVFLDTILPSQASPNFEALLHAEVLNQGGVVGEFWNLNPQSPEPATLSLLALGGLAILRRWARRQVVR